MHLFLKEWYLMDTEVEMKAIYVNIDLHNDSAATRITTVSIPVSIKSSEDTSALVLVDNFMYKRLSLQGKLYALPHPTEDTETANPSQKPLASSTSPILLNEVSGHQLVVQPAVLEMPTDRSFTTVDSKKPLLLCQEKDHHS